LGKECVVNLVRNSPWRLSRHSDLGGVAMPWNTYSSGPGAQQTLSHPTSGSPIVAWPGAGMLGLPLPPAGRGMVDSIAPCDWAGRKRVRQFWPESARFRDVHIVASGRGFNIEKYYLRRPMSCAWTGSKIERFSSRQFGGGPPTPTDYGGRR